MILFITLLAALLGFYLLFKMVNNPVWGLMLIYIVNPFEAFFPSVAGFTMGRIVGLLTTLIWFFHLSRNKEAYRRLRNSRLLKNQLPFHLAGLAGGLAWIAEPDGVNALAGAFTFLILGLLALMVENLITDRAKLRLVASGMAVAGFMACIPAFLYVFGIDLYSVFGAEAPSDLSEETMRATSIGGSPNALGIIARNGIFAAVLAISLLESKLMKTLFWAIIFVCFAGIVLAGSRTNFYGTLIIFMVMGYFGMSRFLKNTSRVLTALIATLVVGIVAFGLVPEPVKQRLLFGGGDDRIAERTNSRVSFTQYQQQQSIDFVVDHPLVGVGINRTHRESGWVAGAHDTISVVLGEMGILGVTSFLWLILWSIWHSYQLTRRAKDLTSKTQLSLLLGSLLSMVVMGVAGGFIIPYDRAFWMVLGLMVPVAYILPFEKVQGKPVRSKMRRNQLGNWTSPQEIAQT